MGFLRPDLSQLLRPFGQGARAEIVRQGQTFLALYRELDDNISYFIDTPSDLVEVP